MPTKTKEPKYKEVSLYNGEVVIHFHEESHKYYLAKDGEVLPKKKQLSGVTGYTGMLDKSRALLPWALRMMKERATELLGNEPDATYTQQEVLAILNVAEKASDEAKTRAAGIGDYVHAFAEEYSKDQNELEAYDRTYKALGAPTDEDKVKIDAGIVGLVSFLKTNNAVIEAAEQMVYSREHGYVGTFDAIMTIDGKRYLVDYKTSNGIYDEHYLQASAYLKAYEEEAGPALDGALIIGIVKEDKEDKDGIIVKRAGNILTEFRTREQIEADFEAFSHLVPIKKRMNELASEWRKK